MRENITAPTVSTISLKPLPLDGILSKLSPSHQETIRLLAEKPVPALLHAYDAGEPIDYYADYVWHLLEKERSFNIEERGRLGLVQPNSDISYLVGFAEPGKHPVFGAVSRVLVHNHDALIEDVQPHDISLSWLRGRVYFLPVTSSGLLVRMELTNSGPLRKKIRIYSLLHRNPNRPQNRYRREYYYSYGSIMHSVFTSAGRLIKAEYDARQDSINLVYDERRPRKGEPVGRLMCCLAAAQKSSGRFFSTSLEGVEIKTKSPKCSGMFYDVDLQPGETKVLKSAVQFQRYNGADGNPYIPNLSEKEAMQVVLKCISEQFRKDEERHIRDSLEAYKSYPAIRVPEQKYPPAVAASLEMPRGETYNPTGKMRRPFYNFCRLNAAETYGWWNYGQHAHESISLISAVITDKKLAEGFLLNHIDMQEPDGKIPYGVSQKGKLDLACATMPIVTWLAWNIFLWSGNRRFLKRVFKSCKKSHAWWIENRTGGTGILCNWLNPHEAVRDIKEMPVWNIVPMQDFLGADVNSFILREEELLAQIAIELGFEEEHRKYAELAARRRQLMNKFMWDSEDKCYYGVSRKTLQKVRIRDIAVLMPLWAGVPSRSRARHMAGMIEDPNEFAAPYPVPTLAVSDKSFGRNVAPPADDTTPNVQGAAPCMGDNWPELTYIVVEGLERYGYFSAAADVAYRNVTMILNDLIATSHFREHYDSISGFGTGLYDYIWSCIASSFLIRFILGIRPAANGLYVRPELPETWDFAGVTNLHIRGSVINLDIKSSRGTPCVVLNGRRVALETGGSVFIPWNRMKETTEIQYTCGTRTRRR